MNPIRVYTIHHSTNRETTFTTKAAVTNWLRKRDGDLAGLRVDVRERDGNGYGEPQTISVNELVTP